MGERRINKLHGCLIEDNRVPELIQKMGSGGLQTITLTGKEDESGQVIFDNLTGEVFDKLKTREYCILLNLTTYDGTEEGVQTNASTFVTLVLTVDDITIMYCTPITDEETILFASFGSGEERQVTGVLTSFGLLVNPAGDIYSGNIIKYLAKTSIGDLGSVGYNSAWNLVQHSIGTSDWQDNKVSVTNITDTYATNLVEGRYNLNVLSLQAVFTINNVKYTTIYTKDAISSFIIINDDLSTTCVTCKCAVDGTYVTFEFKAIKDKTDVTDTIKQGLTNIELYVL